MLKKLFSLSIITLTIASSSAFASCNSHTMTIHNMTNSVWTLLALNMRHGMVYYPYPAALYPGQWGSFQFDNIGLYGPDTQLILSDGIHTEVVRSQQNYCCMEAGNITAYSAPAQFVHYQGSEIGSWWYGKGGKSYFQIG